MNEPCSLDEFIAFIREDQGISVKRRIVESSLIEKDLGITGDDGEALLKAIQRRFSVSFVGSDGSIREAFGLEHDQYLFHSEASFSFRRENVKPLTVGKLFRATCQAHERTRVA